ncbi:two-component system sensor histidine kinase AtoS [Iodobacter ciconiae]|uniref:histidine kinase n=2 Tax=Iodobacter ciconiae TaxID=2496266 RepID=A0A3S8ZXB3_9NEIS|nr:two-component system sensor histidine kinase AtoS [Iodobacter ciconiae]
MLLAISLVCIPTILIAYLVEKQGKDLLLQEKESKLFAFTYMLDLELGNTFDPRNNTRSREEQIKYFNHLLSPRIEALLTRMPNVGVGYYNNALDAIVVYAPEKENGNKVGVRITKHHPGRKVMALGAPVVESGELVRGNIMNAMIPIVRDKQILGYIWANELMDDIDQQTMALDKNILIVSLFGIIVSLFLTSLLSRRLSSDIDNIKEGLRELQFDLHNKIPPLKGEMNDIVDGVNHLAFSLNQAKTLNEMILESTVDGVITVDINGAITTMNPAAQCITGCDPDKVLGKPYQTIIDDQNFKSPLLDTLRSGVEHISVEIDFPVSGNICKLSSSSSLLKNSHGETIGAVVIFKDLTEQKEMQRIVQQAERLAAIGELMAGVAHEIRNPLTAVRGFVQYLQKDTSKAEKDEFIVIILKEVDSINKVIQQLLDFSRPPKNFFSATSLNQLVHDTLILIKSSNSSSTIRFVLNLDESLKDIYLDREMIKQVLLNLLINAVQAIDNGGTITIVSALSKDGLYQRIKIWDTGHGIDEKLKSKIFSPFFTTKPSGTGLGLAIAHKIIASHNGSITIENHEEGGAVVTITLPML